MWKNSQRTFGCSAFFFQNGTKSFEPFRQVKRIICHRQNLANENSLYNFNVHSDNRLSNADLSQSIQIRNKSSVAYEKNQKILTALKSVDEKEKKLASPSAKEELLKVWQDNDTVSKDDNALTRNKDRELLPIFKHLPKNFMYIGRRVDPYVKLMRIDKPIGTWLLFWPCGWSILLASSPEVASVSSTLGMLGLFSLGALVMRGAGCTINDLWDKDIDAKVERTKNRPLVSGAMTKKAAVVFLAAQLSVGLAILLQLNWFSVALGASSMVLVVLYPLAKRVMDWPQLVLGLAFNWGALLGWSALRGGLDLSVCLPLYVAGVCWTLLYDTVYAHQDREDDALVGVRSTARALGPDTPRWLAGFGTGMVGALAIAGHAANLHWPYYACLAAVGTHLATQIATLNMDDPSDCADKFVSNRVVGLLVFLGILLGKHDVLLAYLNPQPAIVNAAVTIDDKQITKSK